MWHYIVKLPLTYLGLSVEGNPRSKKFWTLMVEKVERRLVGLGKTCLSFGGRVTLIRSVLGNLPIYYISLFGMPKGVITNIEELFKNFLWGDKDKKKKVHLVACSEVTEPKSQGGLGVVPPEARSWRFGREKEAL